MREGKGNVSIGDDWFKSSWGLGQDFFVAGFSCKNVSTENQKRGTASMEDLFGQGDSQMVLHSSFCTVSFLTLRFVSPPSPKQKDFSKYV